MLGPRVLCSTVLLFSAFLALGAAHGQAGEEAEGQAAERAGKLREAVTHYVAALQSASEGSEVDQRLRERIINLVQKLDPPPAIPKEAERFMARGQAAIEEAKGDADYRTALAEFQKASRLAPWWPDVYFNLGAIHEKLNNYAESIRNLKLYRLAAPNAQDAKAVESKIFKLEFKQEQITKMRAEAQEQERRRAEQLARAMSEDERRREDARRPERLQGIWTEHRMDQVPLRWRVSLREGETVEIKWIETAFKGDHYVDTRTFHGTVSSGRIVGTVQINNTRYEGGAILNRSFAGTISDDGSTIQIEHSFVFPKEWDRRSRRWTFAEEQRTLVLRR